MKKLFIYIISLLFITNCTLNKVIKHQGVFHLEKKYEKLIINQTNSNDLQTLLGPPSTKGGFDKDLWIYIERSTTSSKLMRLGNKRLLKNDILIVELNTKGILSNAIFLNKNDMKKINFSKRITEMDYTKKSFVYEFLNSMRQKINDPLGIKRN
tara:strand:+ start:509 stop:970 length:462 start_codon:yes stop_codon:yes gene_type:complete